MSFCSPHLHVCCVALGTRGDVQPVACIALHLEKEYKEKVSASLITHTAHSSWLKSGIYASITRKEYVASPPAGGCWAAPDAGVCASAAPAVGGSGDARQEAASDRWSPSNAFFGATELSDRAQPSLVEPDSQVVEAICHRIADAAARCAEGTEGAEGQSVASLFPQLKPLRQQLRDLRRGLEKQEQEQKQRHVILFNLFALEAYHAAEALGLRCAVAAPYMMPYRCPTAFEDMFRRELPELYDTLRRAAELQQQKAAGAEVLPSTGSEQPLKPRRVTFAEVTHWMWPLFTERWGQWRNAVLGLPPLPLHGRQRRRHRDRRGSETHGAVSGRRRPGCAGAGGGPDGHIIDDGGDDDGAEGSDDDVVDDDHEPLPLDSLPAAPRLLYGFSELLVSRLAYWPNSVIVCGFWQPPREWLAGLQLPSELAALLTASATHVTAAEAAEAEAEPDSAPGFTTGPEIPSIQVFRLHRRAAAPATLPSLPLQPPPPPPPGSSRWCLVDFGSSGRLGLIPNPLATLELLDRVLNILGMEAIIFSGGWLPLHQAAQELRNRHHHVLHLSHHPHHGQQHDHRNRQDLQRCCRLEQPQGGTRRDGEQGEATGPAADNEERRAVAATVTTVVAARGAAPAAAVAAAGFQGLGEEPPTEACTSVSGDDGSSEDDDDNATLTDASMGKEIKVETGHARSRLRRRRTQDLGERPSDPKSRAVRMRAETGGDGHDAPIEAATPRLYLYGGDVAHQLVLPYCRLVLHHGGSGMTAAALQCGVPQVICPLHFDQHFWARRLAHLGLSPTTLDRQLLFGSPVDAVVYHAAGATGGGNMDDDPRVDILTSAFRYGLQPARLRAARMMAEDLAAEGSGLPVAAAALIRTAIDSN